MNEMKQSQSIPRHIGLNQLTNALPSIDNNGDDIERSFKDNFSLLYFSIAQVCSVQRIIPNVIGILMQYGCKVQTNEKQENEERIPYK